MNGLFFALRRPSVALLCSRRSSVHTPGANLLAYYKAMIGNREIVGFGLNGSPAYVDRAAFPMPSIRYREPSSEIMALHAKEKGDWRLLTKAEKKALYRASFCQTFAEFMAPKHEWMAIWGYGLMFTSLGIWCYILMATYVYEPLPKSFSAKSRRMQLKRQIHLGVNRVTGLTSHWDYENMRWKDKGRFNPFDCEDEDD